MKKLRIGAVLAAGLMALSFAGTAFAGQPTASSPIYWEGNGWPIQTLCSDTAPGNVLWIFTGKDTNVVLHLDGSTYAGSQMGSGDGSWHILTPYFTTEPSSGKDGTTFVTFTGTDDGTLTISHGCPGTTSTTSSTTSSSTTSSSTTSSSTSTQSTSTSSTTSSETSSTTSSTTSSETTSTSTSTSSSSTSSDSSSSSTTSTSTPDGSVLAETGAPQITPPSTDAVGTSTALSASGSWGLVLGACVALMIGVLVVTPVAKRRGK